MVVDPLSNLKPLGEVSLQNFELEPYTSDNIVTFLRWSPSGMSKCKGCILAVVTLQGDIVLYEYHSSEPYQKFIQVFSCVETLLKLNNISHADKSLEGPEVRNFIFMSMAWSPRFPIVSNSVDKWGNCFLIGGTKSGNLVFFQKNHQIDETLQYISTITLSQDSDDQQDPITKLEWTSWEKGAKDPGKYYSLIVAVTSSNKLVAKLITYNENTQELDFSQMPKILLPSSRFYTTSLSIHTHNKSKSIVCAITQSIGISLFFLNGYGSSTLSEFFSQDSTEPIKSKIFFKTSTGQNPINSVAFLDLADNKFYIVGIADKLNTFFALITMSVEGQPSYEIFNSEKNPIDSFAQKKIEQANEAENDSGYIIDNASTMHTLTFRGIQSNPCNGNYVAILNSTDPINELRYVLVSRSQYRLSFPQAFKVTESDKNVKFAETYVHSIPSSLESSGDALWWTVKALSNSIKSRQERPLFIMEMISEIENHLSANYNNCLHVGDDFKKIEGISEAERIDKWRLKLATSLVDNMYYNKNIDLIRLLIHLKFMFNQMAQVHRIQIEKKISSNEEAAPIDSTHQIDLTLSSIFNEETTNRYAQEIEEHTRFIINELFFIVLSITAVYPPTNSGKLQNNVDRAIIQSYCTQLESNKSDMQSQSVKLVDSKARNRFNSVYLESVLEKCHEIIGSDFQKDEDNQFIPIKGDGFVERFDFSASVSLNEITSQRGYPWSKYFCLLFSLYEIIY